MAVDAFKTVREAAEERVAYVFDHFDRVVVSVSGGKDSTVLQHLAVEEARRRGRTVESFFLDQEAEYAGTVDQIGRLMRQDHVVPRWVQTPILMTNATSHDDIWLHAWGPGESWIRQKDPIAIHEMEGSPNRFYDFFPWFESQHENTAFLVGLRARESMHRWRAMTRNPGYRDILWSTGASGESNVRFYPLYDWFSRDVWRCIATEQLAYNHIYDQMVALRGQQERKMRVSNLVHEQAFRALALLQELEPHTYDAMVRRIGGIHTAALYAEDTMVYSADRLPSRFVTWLEYRDYLVASTPMDKMKRLSGRFSKQAEDESTARQQVRQILTNDWENNVPVVRMKASKLRDLWWDRL